MNKKLFWPLMALFLLAGFVADMYVGAADLSLKEIFTALLGKDVPEETRSIVIDIRLTKTLVAILAGAAVSVSGLLMQTLFRNPLAGPYVLGVSSGASLGAAVFVLGTSSLFAAGGAGSAFGATGNALGNTLQSFGLAGAAWVGSAAVLAIVSLAGRRIKDIMVILILGMMLGSGIDAIVQILQYLSDEASLKSYVMWTMGSLSSVTLEELIFLSLSVLVGLVLAMISIKSLNLLLLGENYAVTMGLNAKRSRNILFLATVLLAGTVTAFCGPLGFVGLAVPHLTRFILREADHKTLVPATMLTGAFLMLACDIVAKTTALPINAITSLVGIPVVVAVVVRNKNI